MTRTLLAAAAAAALVLVACGDDEDSGDASGDIEGPLWTVTETVTDGDAAAVPDGVTATLRIINGQAEVNTGCNSGGGSVEVGDTQLEFGPLAVTQKACEEAATSVEQAVTATLQGTVDYTVNGDDLSLTQTDSGAGLELTDGG